MHTNVYNMNIWTLLYLGLRVNPRRRRALSKWRSIGTLTLHGLGRQHVREQLRGIDKNPNRDWLRGIWHLHLLIYKIHKFWYVEIRIPHIISPLRVPFLNFWANWFSSETDIKPISIHVEMTLYNRWLECSFRVQTLFFPSNNTSLLYFASFDTIMIIISTKIH